MKKNNLSTEIGRILIEFTIWGMKVASGNPRQDETPAAAKIALAALRGDTLDMLPERSVEHQLVGGDVG